MFKRWLLVGLSTLTMVGCTVVSTCDDGGGGIRLFGKDLVEQKLESGVKQYEEGNYVTSLGVLQSIADGKASSGAQKIRANKYIAFIHCISSHEKLCRDAFHNILEINPEFELSSAEAGHPTWGPVFRSVKSKISN